MKDLIEALTILMKYDNGSKWPTHCEHDIMYITSVNPEDVSKEDKERLEELGFLEGDDSGENIFQSFRYGSS